MVISARMVQSVSNDSLSVDHLEQVLFMDPCVMVQTGIRRLLAQYVFHAWGYLAAPSIRDMPLMMARHKVDLIVMELGNESESVFDALRMIKQLRKSWPLIPLIVCTTLTDVRILKQLREMEVSGIYLKQDPLDTFIQCVLIALRTDCEMGISPGAMSLLESDATSSLLSQRELAVLECLFMGSNVTHAAQVLKRDVRTVSGQKRTAMSKLGFRSDCELYTWGSEFSQHNHGWIEDSDRHLSAVS